MVSLDLLSALDGLIWLQSGERVANLFMQHQTTESRNQKKCATRSTDRKRLLAAGRRRNAKKNEQLGRRTKNVCLQWAGVTTQKK